ncbi:uncharacterized protein V1513DRAFT_238531 [Lipomyces chichibuensis]|uniref:uncharacterized protein n=1 Tax=Lipomyces chichibuensis TaxID=1546026 RepID=UPI0033435B4C
MPCKCCSVLGSGCTDIYDRVVPPDGCPAEPVVSEGLRRKKKWRMKRVAAMIRRRIRNLVDDLHCRTAKFLCSSFNLVIFPKFETQQMVTGRGRRRIRSKIQDVESHGHLLPLPIPATPSKQGKGVPLVPCCAGQRGPHKQDLRNMRASEQRRR